MKYFSSALLVIGVMGISSAPVLAQNAQSYASASSSVVLMNGASQSIGSEVALEPGMTFTSGLVGVDVVLDADFTTNASGITSLTLTPTAPIATVTDPNASVEAAVASEITTGAGNDASVSYTRAWQSGAGLQ